MPLTIREFLKSDESAVARFNTRLAGAGVTFAFPRTPAELMPERVGSCAPFQSGYVISDGAEVRGAYILKHEMIHATPGWVGAGNYQLPLSEGIVDRKFAIVGVQLLRDALNRQSRLYCLGMGSLSRPLPQLLQKLGWRVETVPFLFRVERGWAFAREIRWLRQRRGARLLLDLARFSGLLPAFTGLQRLKRRFGDGRLPPDLAIREVERFPPEVDSLFSETAAHHGLLCDRRAEAMNQKLPPQDPRIVRLVLYRGRRLAGWIVYGFSQLRGHTQFGDMALGSIIDGLAIGEEVSILVRAAVARLSSAGCDLIVSNQSHASWVAALRECGFRQGPSNFVLALSPDLAAHVPDGVMHFTRADGDGPINL